MSGLTLKIRGLGLNQAKRRYVLTAKPSPSRLPLVTRRGLSRFETRQLLKTASTETVPVENQETPTPEATAPIPAASTPTPQTKPRATDGFDDFSWTKQWYPVAPVAYLDTKRPQSFSVLGYNVVVWRDGEGQWRAFDDRCPHRNAPLSEGRVNPATGNLQCSYHGWEFKPTGKCANIPQSPDEKARQTAMASPRSCAVAYPTKEKYGLLWMWLEGGEAGQAAAAETTGPVSVPEMSEEGGLFQTLSQWYMREVPVSFESLLENNGDPSHVFFTHHGVLADRKASEPIQLKLKSAENRQFVFEVSGPAFPVVKLLPPAVLWAGDPAGQAGNGIGLLLGAVPMRPGWTRIMTLPLVSKPLKGWMANLLNAQPWLRHVFNHGVHDGDISVLHRQERYVQRRGGKGWRKDYYLPCKSDEGVITLRTWLEKVGGDVPWGPDVSSLLLPPEETRREVLLDRYNQHTKLCPWCSKALANIRAGQSWMQAAAAAAFLGLAYLLGKGTPAVSAGVAAVSAALLLALGVVKVLKNLEQRMTYTNYIHADVL